MISIIIPTYQEEGYIEATLKSLEPLRAPSLKKDFEVIVSDSRSTDKTVEIAKRYADKVVVMEAGVKRGIAKGKNDGAKSASGEYVAFIDADVTIPNAKEFFAKALGYFARDPKLVAITAQIKVEPRLSRLSDRVVYWITNRYFAVFNKLFNFGMSGGEFQMVKTSVFRSIGGFSEGIAASEDMDLFNRLSKTGQVRTAWGLTVYQTGRRFHKVGWARTVYHWIKNALSVWFFKKSSDKEWETIR